MGTKMRTTLSLRKRWQRRARAGVPRVVVNCMALHGFAWFCMVDSVFAKQGLRQDCGHAWRYPLSGLRGARADLGRTKLMQHGLLLAFYAYRITIKTGILSF